MRRPALTALAIIVSVSCCSSQKRLESVASARAGLLGPGYIHHELLLQGSAQEMDSVEARSAHQIIPGLNQILELCMKLLLPPVFDPFLEKFQDHLGHVLGEEFARDVANTVPQDAARKLESTLSTNLAAMLPDGVVAALYDDATERIARIVDEDASPHLEADIVQMSTSVIADRTAALLSKRLPKTLGVSIERALGPPLTESLTKSLTASLAGTLGASMRSQLRGSSSGSPQGLAGANGEGVLRLGAFTQECSMCINRTEPVSPRSPGGGGGITAGRSDGTAALGMACAACARYEQQVLGWLYGRYFGAYFAQYYAHYYSESLQAADLRQHPREQQQQEEAERTGPGSQRPMTAAGTVTDFG